MRTFTHRYGSDITRDQFNLIRADLEGARKHTAPRQIDLYDVFCAMLYTMKMGVLGVISRVIFQSGKLFIITGCFGQNKKTQSRWPY